MNVRLGLICMGSVKLRGVRRKRTMKNEKLLPTVELEPTTLRFMVRLTSD